MPLHWIFFAEFIFSRPIEQKLSLISRNITVIGASQIKWERLKLREQNIPKFWNFFLYLKKNIHQWVFKSVHNFVSHANPTKQTRLDLFLEAPGIFFTRREQKSEPNRTNGALRPPQTTKHDFDTFACSKKTGDISPNDVLIYYRTCPEQLFPVYLRSHL